jgi:Glycoside hydrolase family 5 C-terminal domain/Cellulase (glycosyl hydrolase family 5)
MIRVEGERFVDEQGRTLVLRGVNLGGSSKLPLAGDSFVGRPFPLAEADEHFARLARWGLTTLRLVVTWEAVEHAGPRQYDRAYLDYLEALIARAAHHQLDVFIDFHQDVWSRFTGGDGAPGWTLEAVGFDLATLHDTGAAFLESRHPGPLPKMIWPTNAGKLGAATMFTLFFGGDTFAPRTRVDGASAQRFLQEHFFGAVEEVVRRVARAPNVFGVDLFNEPSAGYIGWEDLQRPGGPVEVGAMPSPLESMALGMGQSLSVKRFHRGLLGPRVVGAEQLNPGRKRAWRSGAQCPWLEHGVWAEGEPPRLEKPQHFSRVGDRQVSFARDFLEPFFIEGAQRIHRLAPELAVLLQGEPFRPGPGYSGTRPAAWAPHWYDGYVLFMKDFRSFVAADAFTQKPVFGAGRIRKSFAAQLGRLAAEARERAMPLLVGELGIAFDLRGGRGGERLQVAAMDRTLTAVEDAGVSATLWNYTADHTRARGDGWNGEDLSIFSRDAAPPEKGRALSAVVRPRPLALAGTPLRYGFERETRRFHLALRRDPKVQAPSLLYVPNLQYPGGARFEVSSGSVEHQSSSQLAVWTHGPGEGADPVTLTLGPASG